MSNKMRSTLFNVVYSRRFTTFNLTSASRSCLPPTLFVTAADRLSHTIYKQDVIGVSLSAKAVGYCILRPPKRCLLLGQTSITTPVSGPSPAHTPTAVTERVLQTMKSYHATTTKWQTVMVTIPQRDDRETHSVPIGPLEKELVKKFQTFFGTPVNVTSFLDVKRAVGLEAKTPIATPAQLMYAVKHIIAAHTEKGYEDAKTVIPSQHVSLSAAVAWAAAYSHAKMLCLTEIRRCQPIMEQVYHYVNTAQASRYLTRMKQITDTNAQCLTSSSPALRRSYRDAREKRISQVCEKLLQELYKDTNITQP